MKSSQGKGCSGGLAATGATWSGLPPPLGLSQRSEGLVTKTPSRGPFAFSAVAARPSGPGGDCGKCEIASETIARSGQSFAPLGQAQRGREQVRAPPGGG